MSETFCPAIALADFPEDGKYATKLAGWFVVIAKTESGFNAFNDRCTHAASFLSTGRIRRGAIMCPLHGARFDLANGKCLGGAYQDLRRFPLRIEAGKIEVAVPDGEPTAADIPIAV
jgi:anthranilate 1,2-dioxygenase ferredoxin component